MRNSYFHRRGIHWLNLWGEHVIWGPMLQTKIARCCPYVDSPHRYRLCSATTRYGHHESHTKERLRPSTSTVSVNERVKCRYRIPTEKWWRSNWSTTGPISLVTLRGILRMSCSEFFWPTPPRSLKIGKLSSNRNSWTVTDGERIYLGRSQFSYRRRFNTFRVKVVVSTLGAPPLSQYQSQQCIFWPGVGWPCQQQTVQWNCKNGPRFAGEIKIRNN